MATLIIVTGFIAALKTTVSTRLAKDLNRLCLNKDHIKEILGDTISFSNREENLKLSKATFQLMKSIVEKEMALDHSMIIESNFKEDELNALKEIIDLTKTKVITLFLTGDIEVLYQRYVSRQPHRHAVHTSPKLMTYDVFKHSMRLYNPEDCFGNVYTIDTTSFNDAIYTKLLKNIETP